MARTEVFEVTCSECETETTVAVIRYPATLYDPPDGETKPEECPKCGKPWDDDDKWEDSEPPEPDYDEWRHHE